MSDAVRTAVLADAGQLAAVFQDACQHGYRGIVADERLDAQQLGPLTTWFAELLASGSLQTLVAGGTDGTGGTGSTGSTDGTGGSADGFIRFGADPASPDDPRRGYVAALYVRSGASGRGLGRALLSAALDQLAAAGRYDVRISVLRDNPVARGLYERAGFRASGPSTIDDFWHAAQLPMRRRPTNLARELVELPAVSFAPVTQLSWLPIHRPLREPFRTALREVRELQAWAVTIRTADGRTGTGTTVATPPITGDDDKRILADLGGPLAGAVDGATDLHASLASVAAAPAGPSARAAVDLALHDLAAGLRGTTLADLLGVSSTAAAPRSDITIALDTPDVMAVAATARLAEGFDTLKVKVGTGGAGGTGGTAADDVARVVAVHHAVAEHPRAASIRLDANQGWTVDEALRVLDGVAAAGIDLELVEQPMAAADLAGMARVRAGTDVPVLADESAFDAADVARIAAAGAADLINLKLLKTGGLWPARAVVTACRQAGLGLLIGCMLEPAEGVAAAAALAAVASSGPLAHDLDAGWWATVPTRSSGPS